MDRGVWWAPVCGVAKSDTAEHACARARTHTHTHTHTHAHTHTVFSLGHILKHESKAKIFKNK